MDQNFYSPKSTDSFNPAEPRVHARISNRWYDTVGGTFGMGGGTN